MGSAMRPLIVTSFFFPPFVERTGSWRSSPLRKRVVGELLSGHPDRAAEIIARLSDGAVSATVAGGDLYLYRAGPSGMFSASIYVEVIPEGHIPVWFELSENLPGSCAVCRRTPVVAAMLKAEINGTGVFVKRTGDALCPGCLLEEMGVSTRGIRDPLGYVRSLIQNGGP